MLQEIERKFRVKNLDFMALASSSNYINQGYLCSDPARTVRIRIQDDEGFLTIKGIGDAMGISRFEWEKTIDVSEAHELFKLAEPTPIEKRRYRVFFGSHWYEVDVFLGLNAPLILAEIELTSIDEKFEKPDWLGKEVTGDVRFYNSYLSKHPYSTWQDTDLDRE